MQCVWSCVSHYTRETWFCQSFDLRKIGRFGSRLKGFAHLPQLGRLFHAAGLFRKSERPAANARHVPIRVNPPLQIFLDSGSYLIESSRDGGHIHRGSPTTPVMPGGRGSTKTLTLHTVKAKLVTRTTPSAKLRVTGHMFLILQLRHARASVLTT